MIPRIFLLGSWPKVKSPLHLPPRTPDRGFCACRKAPSIKKIAISAVAWLTATGVLAISIPIGPSAYEPSFDRKQTTNTPLRAGIHVYIVITRTIVTDVLQRRRKMGDQFFVEKPSHLSLKLGWVYAWYAKYLRGSYSRRGIGSENGNNIIVLATFTILQELCSCPCAVFLSHMSTPSFNLYAFIYIYLNGPSASEPRQGSPTLPLHEWFFQSIMQPETYCFLQRRDQNMSRKWIRTTTFKFFGSSVFWSSFKSY